MKVVTHGELQIGHVSVPIGELARCCPFQFQNHRGDKLLVVTLSGSRDGLLDRLKEARKAPWQGAEPTLVDGVLLVHSRGADALLAALSKGDEFYVVPHDWSGGAANVSSFLPVEHEFPEDIPMEFVQTFQRLGALRYFADGHGTNFCVRSMEDAHDVEQAEQTVGPKWL